MTDLPPTPGPDAPGEPLVSVGTIVAILSAGLGAAVAFGLRLTDDQKSAILTLLTLVAPLIVALVGRTRVFSPKTVRAMMNAKK